MRKSFLIITPSPTFGEFILQSLEEHGDYAGEHISEGQVARKALAEHHADFLILDGELGEKSVEKLINIYRAKENSGPVLLIPPEDLDSWKNLEDLQIESLLKSPFYLPSLIQAVDEIFGISKTNFQNEHDEFEEFINFDIPSKEQRKAPDWIKDIHLAAQYLVRLSLETSSQAAIITYKDQIWAYSGELSQSAAEHIVKEVSDQWNQDDDSDIARFVHLDENDSDYMLYATSLGGHYALDLVFDTKIPFSKMREQASKLAQSLAQEPVNMMAETKNSISRNSMAHDDEFTLNNERAKQNDPVINASPENADSIQRAEFKPELAKSNLPHFSKSIRSAPEKSENRARKALPFSFLQLPRMPHHILDGDLREQISIWLPQLCVAFGWRLEQYQIRSDYVQWAVQISGEQSPISVSKTMEKQLSLRIFNDFARLEKENPSGEFWSQEALIVNGDQIREETISQFIRDTRANQGISLK